MLCVCAVRRAHPLLGEIAPISSQVVRGEEKSKVVLWSYGNSSAWGSTRG